MTAKTANRVGPPPQTTFHLPSKTEPRGAITVTSPEDQQRPDDPIADGDNVEAPGPEDVVTVLSLSAWPVQESTLKVVADRDQQLDHSHRPVPPVAPGGFPYRYKVRLTGASVYASTADEVLALFIDGYDPRPGRGRDAELAHITLRGEHCIGVIVNHVAQAMIAGVLSPEEEQLLQRSAAYGAGQDPITADECANWGNVQVPMLLMGDLYAAEYGQFTPPAGNVQMLWPGRAERYLEGLAGLGLIAVSENPGVTAAPFVEVRGVGS